MGSFRRRSCCKKMVNFSFHNVSMLVGKRDASMDLRVIVCKTVIHWLINPSATGKYCWCFWVKCEDSGARNAKKADVTYLLEQGCREANIACGVVNNIERTETSETGKWKFIVIMLRNV